MGEIPDRPGLLGVRSEGPRRSQRSSSTWPFASPLACEARPLAAFCQTTLCGDPCPARRPGQRRRNSTPPRLHIYRELGMRPLPLDPVR